MRNKNLFATASTALTAAVANAGTFTVAYPSGTSQLSFTSGLNAPTGSFMIINNVDRWTVAASQMSITYGASNITVTNNTGTTLAAGASVLLQFERVDGNDIVTLPFAVNLASITTAQDIVTGFRPGIDGVIEDISFVVNVPVTTASKLATISLKINSTAVTGGAIAATSAAATPMGKVLQGTDITALSAIGRDDTLSIVATAVTAFLEGSGTIFVRIRRNVPDAW